MQYGVRQPNSTPKLRRQWKVWAIITVVLAVGMAIFVLWAVSDNKAKDTTSNVSHAKPEAAYQAYKSKYISLMYKGSYKEKTRTVQEPGVEQVLLRADTTYEKTLAIEVQPLPQNGLSADSGYGYRQLHPELYQAQQITVAGALATKWIKNDGTEQTIYLPHGTNYAVISFSLARTNDTAGLPDEVAALLQSFHWK